MFESENSSLDIEQEQILERFAPQLTDRVISLIVSGVKEEYIEKRADSKIISCTLTMSTRGIPENTINKIIENAIILGKEQKTQSEK